MITKKFLLIAIGGLCSLAAVFSSEAHAVTWDKFECQAVPSTGARTYNTNIQCAVEITRTGASKWHNAYGQHCPTFCQSIGGVNVASPDGFACTSGEERPWSAIQAGVDYRPTGCWHDCRYPEGSAGGVSVGGRCYAPGQKRDNDRTDTTVGCFCETGEVGVTSIEVGITTQGVARASGVGAYPSGWSRVDKNAVNDTANRIIDVVGQIPLGGKGTISMSINVQGACGTSAVLGGTVYGGQSSLQNVTVPLPACVGQCSDGVDNDQDGATDLADFSCQNDAARDDEANPKSQCQNGTDDDNDGLIDLNDTGCSNAQDNNEGDGTTQCQDGIDNDGDGAKDTADFSCSNPQDNDEANPKSQCQNATDDDNDGLIDLRDPGCANAQDNNEGDGATQCQDGIDNDGDGAKDTADFSCSNPQDNDEANPKSQCQNTTDDDNDGLIDLSDPGCSNAQDNNESDGTSQCQDTTDNDGDGLIDLRDPGCSNPQDNTEGDEAALLTVGIECVTSHADGSKTAYFSYNNTTGTETTVVTNTSLGTVNEFVVSGGTTPPPPTLFKSGVAKGAVVVRFTGDSLSWLVRAPKSSASRATASATSPVCAPVVPLAECRSYEGGALTVQLGYSNGNQFEQQIAVGSSNQFTPGAADRGQPSKFFAGLNKGVFKVSLASDTESLRWIVNESSVKIDSTLRTCANGCTDTPTGTITSELDAVAQQLSDLMTRAANILASTKARSGEDVAVQKERNRADAERAKKKAQSYAKEAKEITLQFPNVIKTCPEAPAFCQTVDRQPAIDSLRVLYANQVNSIKRTMARSYFRSSGKTNRSDANVKQAKELQKQGLASLAKFPRFDTQCK